MMIPVVILQGAFKRSMKNKTTTIKYKSTATKTPQKLIRMRRQQQCASGIKKPIHALLSFFIKARIASAETLVHRETIMA